MIKHIVCWKLHDRAKAPVIKAALEALPGVIAAIGKLEVGIGLESGEVVADVALYSEFASLAELGVYMQHPEHLKVVALIRPLVSERRVIDYDTGVQ